LTLCGEKKREKMFRLEIERAKVYLNRERRCLTQTDREQDKRESGFLGMYILHFGFGPFKMLRFDLRM